jgi:hypothetical protein
MADDPPTAQSSINPARYFFGPPTRGVAIASQELLLRAGLDRPPPTGWLSREEGNVFELVTGVHTRFLGDIGPKSARRDIMKLRLDEPNYNKWCSFL